MYISMVWRKRRIFEFAKGMALLCANGGKFEKTIC